MLKDKRGLISVWFVFANAWTPMPAVGQSDQRTCYHVAGRKCTFDKLNFYADGLQRLRASVTLMQDVFTVQVNQLISPFADGVMLALFGEYVDKVYYEKYHDRSFRIPAGCTLSEITIDQAPQLQEISVATPNDRLDTLSVAHSGLLTLPNSLLNLHELTYLIVVDSALQTVRLDPFANSPKLSTLTLSYNKVANLVASDNPDLFVSINDLALAYNQLQFIDGAFFRPLRNLIFLTLEGNRLQRIGDQHISFPKLIYLNFESNQMSHLNVSSWRAPCLQQFSLVNNNFTKVPVGMERLPNLTGLYLSYNHLPAIDLHHLQRWPKLDTIDVSNNRIQTVLISLPGRVSLPLVNSIILASNRIAQIQFDRWDMPMLSTLTLAFNQFVRLPDLFQLFPKLERVLAYRNPFRCGGLRPLEKYLALNTLTVDSSAYGVPCATNASYTVPTGRVICCQE